MMSSMLAKWSLENGIGRGFTLGLLCLTLLIFLSICIYVFLPSWKPNSEEAALLPLGDDYESK